MNLDVYVPMQYSFRDLEVSRELHSTYLIYFLFERACQDAGHDKVLFSIKLCFYYIYTHLHKYRTIFRKFFLDLQLATLFLHLKK
jgi:hypothetical protein